MLKSLQPPLRGLLAVAFLFSAAPMSRAAFDSDLYDSLLKKIYRNSDDNNGDDIYSIVRKALESHSDQDADLVKKLFKKLRDNRKKLDNNVSKKDLDDVERRLLKFLKKRRPQPGPISPPESPH